MVKEKDVLCKSTVREIQVVLADGTIISLKQAFAISSLASGDNVQVEKNGKGFLVSHGFGDSLHNTFQVEDNQVTFPKLS